MSPLSSFSSSSLPGSNDGWWETAGNWKTDSPDGPADASKPATGDTVYIGAGGNINVKIGSNGGSNKTKDALLNLEIKEGKARLVLYTTGANSGVRIIVKAIKGLSLIHI